MPGYHLPLFTAAAKGIWADHGLDVEIVDPERGPANVHAVAAGQNDACLTSVAHYMRAKREDPDVAAKFVFMVARRTHLSGFCVEGEGIGSFTDLEGASLIGPDDSPFTREYGALVDRLGIAPGERVDVPYGKVERALADRRGDLGVDYLELLPRFESPAAKRGLEIRPLPFYEAGVVAYGSGLVAGTRMIEERPEVVRRLVAALRDAIVETRDDPRPGFAAMQRRFPGLQRERVVRGWTVGLPLVFADGPLGQMDAPTWQRTIDHQVATHDTPRVQASSVFDATFA